MYCVRWRTCKYVESVIVEFQSLLTLLDLFEKTKTRYKVTSVQGYHVTQVDFGWGGFIHWINADDGF